MATPTLSKRTSARNNTPSTSATRKHKHTFEKPDAVVVESVDSKPNARTLTTESEAPAKTPTPADDKLHEDNGVTYTSGESGGLGLNIESDDEVDEVGLDYYGRKQTLFDHTNTVVFPRSLNSHFDQGLIKSIILAFCSNTAHPFGYGGDVQPMPNSSKRLNNGLIFKVTTGDLVVPTRSGWTFRYGDEVDVNMDSRERPGIVYFPGEIVMVVFDNELTIMEVRAVGDEPFSDNEDCELGLYDLREGLQRGAFIIGQIKNLSRGWSPVGDRPEKDAAQKRHAATSPESRDQFVWSEEIGI